MEFICPVCDCEVPAEGNEKAGDLLVCPYCQAPLLVKKDKGKGELTLEEDY